MGATNFEIKYKAMSLADAYDNAVSDARDEYGNDQYNGTISTTNGCVDVTRRFKASGKSLDKFVDEAINECHKWGKCYGICIKEPKQNTNKIKSVVKNLPNKGALKWVTQYVVYARMDNAVGKPQLKKADAVKLARQHTEKTKERTTIYIEKHLANGSSRVAEIEYKGSTNEAVGEFYLFGLAAE